MLLLPQNYPTNHSVNLCGAKYRKGSLGFSLVEVTLAIGLVGFVILVMLNMMPVGMSVMREAMDRTLETQIVRQLTATALLTPFDEISTSLVAQGPYYYDEYGVRQNGRNAQTSRYEVSLARTATIFPGSSNLTGLTNSLTTLSITVKCLQGVAATNSTNVYAIVIPNSGG